MQIAQSIVRHNWHWKLLALALAVLLKVYVQKQENILHASYLLPVNITAPAGERVVEPPPGFQVHVELDGPAEVVRLITGDDITLDYDASAVQPGKTIYVPITPKLPAKYSDRVTIDWRPRSVPVKLVSDAVKQFPVSVKIINHLQGWEMREPPHVDPPRVAVSGAEEAVGRVAQIVAPLTLDPSERINALVTLAAVDQTGTNVTDQVRIEPAQVEVTGLQQSLVLTRRIPVQPVFHAPPGARVTVEVEPPYVNAVGPASAVGKLYVLNTEPVPLQGAPNQPKFVRETSINVPAGVQVTPSRVRVTIRISR